MTSGTVSRTMRDRVVDAAIRVTTERGWAKVTMSRLADDVGVSRQTVYNEVGSKNDLAEAMVERELARFLSVVVEAFDAHPDDLVAAIRTSTRGVLEHAHDNRLLHAVVSATHGADTELLPLLTTNSEALLSTAKAVLVERVTTHDLDLPDDRRDAVVDTVVRVVLSHVMQPSADPVATADDVAWIAARVLR